MCEPSGYPGFREDALEGFSALAHDIALAQDFLVGDASALRGAAQREAEDNARRSAELIVGYVGDTRTREQLLAAFRARQYAKVVDLAASLKYPERMEQAELRMIAIARGKVSNR